MTQLQVKKCETKKRQGYAKDSAIMSNGKQNWNGHQVFEIVIKEFLSLNFMLQDKCQNPKPTMSNAMQQCSTEKNSSLCLET